MLSVILSEFDFGQPLMQASAGVERLAAEFEVVPVWQAENRAYTPSTLRQSVAYLEAHPDCALAVSYYDVIDDVGRAVEHLGDVRHLEYDRNAILRTNGAGTVRVWHRCILERLGGFREEWFPDYAEDYDMILRLSERYAVGQVPNVLNRCRLHASNSDQRLSTEDRARKKALARAHALDRRARLLRSASVLEGAARD